MTKGQSAGSVSAALQEVSGDRAAGAGLVTAADVRAVNDVLSQQDDVLSMSARELFALPVSVPLVIAARAFGLARTKAHELARAGEFPCRVIRVGQRYRVPRSALLEALGYSDPLATAVKADGTPRPAT